MIRIGFNLALKALLLCLVSVSGAFAQTTFYSSGSGNFTTLTNWNTESDASGTNPVLADLFDGLNTFIIQNADAITINDAVDLAALRLSGSAVTVATSSFTVGNYIQQTNANLNLQNHNLTLSGSIVRITGFNSGNIDGTGQIIFNGTIFQQISIESGTMTISPNVRFESGGVVIANGSIAFGGNFELVDDVSFTMAGFVSVPGNFLIDVGSSYQQTTSRIEFYGSSPQTIDAGRAEFNEVRLNNSAKTMNGDITANGPFLIYGGATVTADGTHTFGSTLDVMGTFTVSGTVIHNGGTIRNNTGPVFDLHTAALQISGGTSTIATNTELIVRDDVQVFDGGRLVIDNGSALTAAVGGLTLELSGEDPRLYMRGADNFPTTFANFIFSETAALFYDANIANQTVRGGLPAFGRLYLRYQNKQLVDGPLQLFDRLDLITGANFNTGVHDLDVGGIVETSGAAVLTSGGTVRFNNPDGNQTFGAATYQFTNLEITSDATTALRTKTFSAGSTIAISNNFVATNVGGTETNRLIIRFGENPLTGGNNFFLGDHVELSTRGETELRDAFNVFTGTITLEPNSIVNYDRSGNQDLAEVTYGKLWIAGSGNRRMLEPLTVSTDIRRTGGSSVLVDNGHNITILGDWGLVTAAYPSPTSTTTFSGTSQEITVAATFRNIVFAGTGTKSITTTQNILGNLTIENGVTFNGGDQRINIYGNWSSPGTGAFIHTDRVYFMGNSSQTITSNSSTTFNDVYIEKTAPNFDVTLTSDVLINGRLDFAQNAATLNLDGNTVFVGENFVFRTGAVLNPAGGTVHFNGSATQTLNNAGNANFHHLSFSGSGNKVFTANQSYTIQGDFESLGAAINASNNPITIFGNWTQSGSFTHSNGVTISGTDQTIDASGFHDVIIAASGITTLASNISVNRDVIIQNGATLDVSPANFEIEVGRIWNNSGTGTFVPRNGTVVFNGTGRTIEPGGIAAGKAFYNFRSDLNTGQRITIASDLQVINNLRIVNGIFRTGIYDIEIGGSLNSTGVFEHNQNTSTITFVATSGTPILRTSGSALRSIVLDMNPSVVLEMQDDLTLNNAHILTLTSGILRLNGNTLTAASDVTIAPDAELHIDAGAFLLMPNGSVVQNNGGVFRLVGADGNPATVGRVGTGGYQIIQSSGTFHARYFEIRDTNNQGVQIQGGTLDNTNNFSDGTFNSGGGTQYLNLNDLDLGAGTTASNTIFNAGPTYNVTRLTGNGAITFEDASGSLAGASFDNEAGGRIIWTFPGGFFWTGATNTNWHVASNWAGNTVPENDTDNVILDFSENAGPYSVDITDANVHVNRIIMNADGGPNTITLTLANSRVLTIEENLNVSAFASFVSGGASSEIFLGRNLSNSGTLNFSAGGTLTFNGVSGVYSISTGGSALHNLTIDADGATYVLGQNLVVNNNISVVAGTLDASNSGNHSITVGGNWSNSGLNTFLPRSGTVTFNRASAGTQTVSGGPFFNMTAAYSGAGSATVQLASNLSVERDLTIQPNTTLNGGTFNLFVGRNWINNSGPAAFTQTGSGSVNFSGGGTQRIDLGSESTTYNNLTLSGTGTKRLDNDITVLGTLLITGSVDVFDLYGFEVTGTGANTFNMAGTSMLRIRANNFPTTFGTFNLSLESVVEYRSNSDQDIFDIVYGGLALRRENAGNLQTKHALGHITVNGTLTIGDADTELNMNNFNLTLGGGLGFPAGGRAIQWGTGTFTHNGGNFTLSANFDMSMPFNNIIWDGTGWKRLASDIAVNGNVTVRSGIDFDMREFILQGNNGVFTLQSDARLRNQIPSTLAPALPLNFDTYDISIQSDVRLEANVPQTLESSITYGAVQFANGSSVTLNGNTNIRGDFTIGTNVTFTDNGHNLTLGGETITLNNYTASGSSTLTLDRTGAQLLRETAVNSLNLSNVVLSGAGVKTIGDGNDDVFITGTLTVNGGATYQSNRPTTFSGSTITNNGTISITGNTFTFAGAGAKTINPGVNNEFHNVVIGGFGNVTVITNGIYIARDLTINFGRTLTLADAEHRIDRNLEINGTLAASNSDIIFGGGTQSLDPITARDVTLQGSGTKTMQGNWTTRNLTIDNVTLNSNNFNLFVSGDWSNSGTFTYTESTVTFNGSSTPVTIDNGTSQFYNVTFDPASPTIYQLEATQTRVRRHTIIEEDATLFLNGNIFIAGANSALLTGQKRVDVRGTLHVDPTAQLRFDNGNGSVEMEVEGRLRVVGTNANLATVTNTGGGSRHSIVVTTGVLEARHYLFEYLVDDGLIIEENASIDPVNNLSFGTWSNMRVGGAELRYYLVIDADVTGLPDIENVIFNFAGTPVVGRHFNVSRDAASVGTVTFAGSISGVLAGEAYENDPGSLIDWPIPLLTEWIGIVSTDWHVAANWSSGSVPVSATDVIITSNPNAPVISGSDAEANNITISNGGALSLSNNRNLSIGGNFQIGVGTTVGVFIVSSAGSEVTVTGNWERGTNGIFNTGGETIIFNAEFTTVNIIPRGSPFSNVTLDGDGTFQFIGTDFNINGNLVLNSGTLEPATNYQLFIQGDFFRHTDAIFSNAITGTIHLVGGNQLITNGLFNRLVVAGTDVKTFAGDQEVSNIATIESTLRTNPGASFTFLNNVTIESTGVWDDDGDGVHFFRGVNWTGNGSHTGTGTIRFDRAGGQNLRGGSFYNLVFDGTGNKVLLDDDVEVKNDLEVTSTPGHLNLTTRQITQPVAQGIFTLAENQTLFVRAANNFPVGFNGYDLHETSTVRYDAGVNQTIRGGITYGNLVLNNPNVKTLDGTVFILRNLTFNNSTLDVSPDNHAIFVGGVFDNNGTGSFVPRLGEVILNGSAAGNQDIRIGASGAKDFYKLTINKPNGTARITNNDVTISNSLLVTNGNFNANGNTITIGADLIATNNGAFISSGKFILNRSTGSVSIGTNNSAVRDLDLDGSATTTFNAIDDIRVDGNFRVMNGHLQGNGRVLHLGLNNNRTVTISDRLTLGAGGELRFGNGTTVQVESGAQINLVGTPSEQVRITRNAAGTYGFTVNGTIAAEHYVFEFTNVNGVQVFGSIHATHNFSNGTFTNGAANGRFLRIENTQNLVIDNVSFPTIPGGSSNNVVKTIASSGNISFPNASGIFAGELYENDPFDLIDWPTPVVLTWTGAVNEDWYEPNNWTASAGPNIVPNATTDVIIPVATNQPIITVEGAEARGVTINQNSSLKLNTSDSAIPDLIVHGDLNINGLLEKNSANDLLEVRGSWVRGNNGTYVNGGALVTLNAPGGNQTLNNRTAPFHSLRIQGSGTYVIGANNTTIANNLTIASGTLDVSASNHTLRVGGSWNADGGSFISRSGRVLLNATSAGPFEINSGGNSFHNLDISPTAAAVYELNGTALTVTSVLNINEGTLDLNSQNLSVGNGTGSNELNVFGTLTASAGSSLIFGNTTEFVVKNGGTAILVGSDESNRVVLTRTGSGNYGMLVENGATIDMRYYTVQFLNTSGIIVHNGATVANLDPDNNFSDGIFSNGATGGRYLDFPDRTTNITNISNVIFNAGATFNVRATSGTGNFVQFVDATGVLAGPIYEEDDNSPTTGAVRWVSTSSVFTWTGAASPDWHDNANWIDESAIVPAIPPTTDNNVIIPSAANAPVISSGDAAVNNLTISDGLLTIENNRNLLVDGSVNIGGILTVADGSTTVITVRNTWANTGTFNPGTTSTVTFTANTGVRSIEPGASSFRNLTINGNATFEPSSNMTILGNLTLSAGNLDVTVSNHQLEVRGNWVNNATFTPRNGIVLFSGNQAQQIDAGGTGVGKAFYNVDVNKTGNVISVVSSDLRVGNDLTLIQGTINLGSQTTQIGGNWTNFAASVQPATSTVVFNGTGLRSVSTNNQSFNNLEIAMQALSLMDDSQEPLFEMRVREPEIATETLAERSSRTKPAKAKPDLAKVTYFPDPDSPEMNLRIGEGRLSLSSNMTVLGNITVTSGTLFLNGRILQAGTGANEIIVNNGSLNIDAGAFLRIHQNTTASVLAAGTVRVIGDNAASVANIAGLSDNPGWQMTVNGSIHASFGRFRHSAGNGISVTASATIDELLNFSNSVFENGTGTSYLTLANDQHLLINNVRFEPGPTYNVQALVGDGRFTFMNFSGDLGGDRFENDPGPQPGRVRWEFVETQSILSTGVPYRFGNEDFVFTPSDLSGGLTSLIVSQHNNGYLPDYNTTSKFYRVNANGQAVGQIQVTFNANDAVESGMVVANLRIWSNKGTGSGAWTRLDPVVDLVNQTLTYNGFTMGGGNIPNSSLMAMSAMNGDGLFNQTDIEEFVISDALDETALPVELVFFEVETQTGDWTPQLRWVTATEYENYGFFIERAFLGITSESLTDTSWVDVAFLEGQGTVQRPTTYVFRDTELDQAGRYLYRLRQMDFDGTVTVYNPIEFQFDAPEVFRLFANYPNPFNPITTIPYEIARESLVTITVFDALGRRVGVLKNEVLSPGRYVARFDGTQLASGIYFVRMTAEGQQFTHKMMLIK